MKKLSRFCVLFTALLLAALTATAQTPLKVAIYDDEGTGPSKLNVSAALSDPALFDITWVMGADIRAGILDDFDVLIHPGGSGSGQGGSLEESGRDIVRAYIAGGGGYLGICAGAYLATSHYSWSLNLLNAKVIDTAHWNRGGGQADVLFGDWGRDFYGFPQDTVMIEYRQGPLMSPANLEDLPAYIEAGTFQTEFTENGAAEGVMIGSTAFAFSRYQEGRVVAYSPHPEITAGREYMIGDAVQWAASNDPYLGIGLPLNHKPLEVSTVTRIEWVAENAADPVLIEFSSDDGATWDVLATGQVDPLNWTVPNTPAESCVLRVTSLADGTLVDTVRFPIIPAPLSIQSVQTGNWSDPATWDDGIVPGVEDNVIIGSAHIVTVDVDASCIDLSFVDGSGRLGLQADLRLYGDFNRYGTSDNPFYSGGNLWASGAKMIFTGDAEVQAITGLGTSSTSPYPLRFQEIVVDKSFGKLTTNPVEGTAAGYRIGIGVSLEIVSGTFELGSRDDIEGRTTAGTSATPTITVGEGCYFNMLGSYSHIRRGNFVGSDSSKIGKLTVYGEANLAGSSSNRINLGGIDIEDGGLVTVPYYSTGGSMGTGRLNPGTITAKDGGTFKLQLINNIWYDNTTTPNQIALQEGGTVLSYSSAPQYPPFSENEGRVVYGRGSTPMTVFDMDYNDLVLSGDAGVVFESDITVNGTCSLTGGSAVTGDYALMLGPDADLVEDDGSIVMGTVDVTRTAMTAVNQDFGGIGLEILADGDAPGLTRVVRTTGSFAEKAAYDGITRYFEVLPTVNSGLDASVLFHYDESEVLSGQEGALKLFSGSGQDWTEIASIRDTDANTVFADGLDMFTKLTLGYEGVVATDVQSVSVLPRGAAVDISWSMMTPVAAGDFSVFRVVGDDRVALDCSVVATGAQSFQCVDRSAEPGSMCAYQITMIQGGVSRVVYETEAVEIPRGVFKLSQNIPNPFNPLTSIEYSLPRGGHVTLDVYDVAGQRVIRLVDGVQAAGVHRAKWAGNDQRGNPVSSGTYFYRMASEEGSAVRKMVLLR